MLPPSWSGVSTVALRRCRAGLASRNSASPSSRISIAWRQEAPARQLAIVLVAHHRLVRGEVVVARDGVGDVIAQQDFAFQAQVGGARHLTTYSLSSCLSLKM
jgi:hypothetical protein